MNYEDSIKLIVTSFPFFKNLSDANADSLLTEFTVKDFQKNQFIFGKGDPATYCYIVVSGWVKLFNVNDESNISSIQLLSRGDVLGLDAIFDDGVYLYSAESVNDCRLLAVPTAVLKENIRINPVLAANLLGILSHRIKEMQIASACFLLGDASRRLSCLLLRLSSWMVGKGGTFKLPYGKAIAAEHLGMDQATLSRALSRLDALGVKSGNGEVTIDDFAKLSAHSCTHCPILEGQCPGRRMKYDPDAQQDY